MASEDHRLQRRWGEVVPVGTRVRHPEAVSDLRRGESPELADLPGVDGPSADRLAAGEHLDRRHLPPVGASDLHSVPHPNRAREHAHVGDLLGGRTALDLEDHAGCRSADIAMGGWQQLGDAGEKRVDARPRDGRAEEHRVHEGPRRLPGELAAESFVRDARIVEVGGDERVVAEELDEPLGVSLVGRAVRGESRPAGAEVAPCAHLEDRRRETRRDLVEDAIIVRAASVDLVHEQQRGNAPALQGPHEQSGLHLHALDGREHEHGAVEHGQARAPPRR